MKKQKQSSPIERLSLFIFLLIAVNIGILVLLENQKKTILLLQDQRFQLESDQKILASSEEIYDTYKNDLEDLLAVFPDESSVLDFIQTLERISKEYASESSVRLSTRNPLPEGDKLFLLFSITLKTEKNRLYEYMERLETLPYMTRLLSVNTTYPEQQSERTDASLALKLYVKNPFTAK